MTTIQALLREKTGGQVDVWTSESSEQWQRVTVKSVTADAAFFINTDGQTVVIALAHVVAVVPW